ncbi:hypothetical protein N9S81_00255, partial [bacterium]|nr:hypothetical protein [bacterium]
MSLRKYENVEESSEYDPPLAQFFRVSIGDELMRQQQESTGMKRERGDDTPINPSLDALRQGLERLDDSIKRALFSESTQKIKIRFFQIDNMIIVLKNDPSTKPLSFEPNIRVFLKQVGFEYDGYVTRSNRPDYLRWYYDFPPAWKIGELDQFLRRIEGRFRQEFEQQQQQRQQRQQRRQQEEAERLRQQQRQQQQQQEAERRRQQQQQRQQQEEGERRRQQQQQQQDEDGLLARLREAIQRGVAPDPEDVRRAKGTWGDRWLSTVEPSIHHTEMARTPAESDARWEDPLDLSLLSLLKRLSAIIGSGFINVDDTYTKEDKTYEELDVRIYGRMVTPLGGATLYVRTTASTKGKKVWSFKFYPKGRPKSNKLEKVTTARMIEQGYEQGQVRGFQALIIALNALWKNRIDNGADEAEL